MLTQQYLPGNVLRIRFYAHLQRARLRCIAWTSPKKNKYYATVKFFMKHYSNATSLKPRYFRQGPFTSLWLVLVHALQVVFCSKVSSLQLWPLYLEISISTLISYGERRTTKDHYVHVLRLNHYFISFHAIF